MICHLSEPTRNRDGSFTLPLTGIKDDVYALYDELKGKECEATIKKHHTKRSLTANAYAWVLIHQIAERQGIGEAEYYRRIIKESGIKTEDVCVRKRGAETIINTWMANGLGYLAERLESKIEGCVVLRLFFGSSAFDSAEMARFIDTIVQDAESIGIHTVTDNELSRMKDGWKGKA